MPVVKVSQIQILLAIQAAMISILKDPSFRASFDRIVLIDLSQDVEKNFLHQVLSFAMIVKDANGHTKYQPIVTVEED